MYLAMIDNVYGCEYTYVDKTEEKARRGLIKKIIISRRKQRDNPDDEFSGITFGDYNFCDLIDINESADDYDINYAFSKKRTSNNEKLDSIAEYYGVAIYRIEQSRFECDREEVIA
jgi:hypothetical protein